MLSNPVLKKTADHHGVSVSQAALRFLVQQGIIIIPKMINPEHMKDNLAVLDFELEPEEMAAIEKLDTGKTQFKWW